MAPRYILFTLLTGILFACQPVKAGSTPVAGTVTTGVMIESKGFIQRIHDPVIAQENGTYFNNKWHMYYAVSSFGSQNSAIGLATNL